MTKREIRKRLIQLKDALHMANLKFAQDVGSIDDEITALQNLIERIEAVRPASSLLDYLATDVRH